MNAVAAGNHTSSRAVVFSAVNALATQLVTLPAPGSTDLLVRTHRSGIVPVLEGPLLAGAWAHLPGLAFPLVPGYAAVGEVIAIGSDVPAEWHGTPVFAAGARTTAGMRAAGGTHGAHLVVPVDAAVRLPDSAPPAATILTQVAMALHALDLAAIMPGCRALVLGQGLAGQVTARVLRARGAGRIIVADTSARRLTHARADEAIRLTLPTDDRNPGAHPDRGGDLDFLIDTTGEGRYVTQWLPALRRGGALLLLSGTPPLNFIGEHGPRGALRVVRSSDWAVADLTAASRLIAMGAITLDDLISHTLPIERVGQAYVVALSDPDAMQVVLTWT